MRIKCPTCGCKVRGNNHEQGEHHQKQVKRKSSGKKS